LNIASPGELEQRFRTQLAATEVDDRERRLDEGHQGHRIEVPGAARWSNRWKAALNAFDFTFDGRLSAGRK
jgi:hypothetical protein